MTPLARDLLQIVFLYHLERLRILAVPLRVDQLSKDVIHQLQPAPMVVLVGVLLEFGCGLSSALEDLAEGLEALGGLVVIASGRRCQGKGRLLMCWLRKVRR